MAKSDERRLVRFSWETLELTCEWETCTFVDSVMHSFVTHIDDCHLSTLSDSDLHCHWKDCEGFTESLPELRRHILFHAFHTKIKCYGRNLQIRKKLPICFLDSHSRNMIPELPDPFVCCWENCQDVFESPEAFYRHTDAHVEYVSRLGSRKVQTKCYWTGCHRAFADQYKLKDHTRSHTQEKVAACPNCGGMFASRTKFLDHIQRQTQITDNNQDTAYTCEYCSRKMPTERLLRDHMRFHVNHYKCPYCDMTCPTPSGMQVHISYRHSESKPHSCQYCDYKCKSQNDLRKHLETHSEIPAYTCSVEGCNYASRSQTCYKSHFRSKHEGEKPLTYACHLCTKTTTRGNYLTRHLIEHHKFRWPSGHCRFRYHQHADGRYRLQTVRYESLELSEAMMCENEEKIDAPDTTNEISHSVNETVPTDGHSSNSNEENLSESILPTNVESTAATNSSLGGIPLLVYVQKEGSEQPAATDIANSIADNNEGWQVSHVDQQQAVVVQILGSDKPLVTPDGSSLVFLEMPEKSSLQKEPRMIQIMEKVEGGVTRYQTAHVIAEGGPSLDSAVPWTEP